MSTRRIRSWLGAGALAVSVVAGLTGPAGAAEPLDPAMRETIEANDPLTLPAIRAVARGVGLDPDRLDRDMAAPEVARAIERNQALAQALGVNATLAVIVGAVAARGAMDLGALRELVARARAR